MRVRGNTGPSADRSSDPPAVAVASAFLFTLGASGSVLIFSVLRAKLYAVLLGVAAVGAVSNLLAFLTLLSATALAFSAQGGVRELAAALHQRDNARVRSITQFTIVAPALIGLVAALLLGTVPTVVASLVTGAPAFGPMVLVALAAIPALALQGALDQILQAYGRIANLAVARVAVGLVATAVTVPAIVLWGPTGAFAALIAAAAFRVVWQLVFERPTVGAALSTPFGGFSPRSVAGAAGVGFASVGVSLSSTAAVVAVRALVASRLGISAAGIYVPVSAISDTYMDVLLGATALYVMPRIAALASEGNLREVAATIGSGIRLTAAVATPILVVLTVGAVPVVELLYSGSFREAGEPLAIQMLGQAPKAVAWGLGVALIPLGRTRAWVAVSVASLVIRVAGAALLVPSLGLNGVALAYDMAYVITAAAMWSTVRRAGVVVDADSVKGLAICGVCVAVAFVGAETGNPLIFGTIALAVALAAFGPNLLRTVAFRT